MAELEQLPELGREPKSKRLEESSREIGPRRFAEGQGISFGVLLVVFFLTRGAPKRPRDLAGLAIKPRPDPWRLRETLRSHLADADLQRAHRVLAALDRAEAQREVFPQLIRVVL